MRQKFTFLLLAILAVSSMAGIGIFISLSSVLGIVGSILLLIIIMGSGFSLKRKWREQEKI